MIQLRCPKSGATFTTDDSARGTSVLCPHCGGAHFVSGRSGPALRAAPAVARPPAPEGMAPPLPSGLKGNYGLCVNHPEESAIGRCRRCRKALCQTCSFMAGLERFCGDCAGTPDDDRVKKLRGRAIGSIICGAVGMLIFGGAFVAATGMAGDREDGAAAMVGCGMLVALAFAVGGLSMGLSSRDKTVGTSPLAVIGIIVSALTLGIVLLLMLAGTLMGG